MKNFLLAVSLLFVQTTFAQPKQDLLTVIKKTTKAQIVANLEGAKVNNTSNNFLLSNFVITNYKDTTITSQKQATVTYSFIQKVVSDYGSHKTGETKSYTDWKIVLAKNEADNWEAIKCGYY